MQAVFVFFVKIHFQYDCALIKLIQQTIRQSVILLYFFPRSLEFMVHLM